jgi:hypothetical protein
VKNLVNKRSKTSSVVQERRALGMDWRDIAVGFGACGEQKALMKIVPPDEPDSEANSEEEKSADPADDHGATQ